MTMIDDSTTGAVRSAPWNLADVLDAVAGRVPDAPAVIDGPVTRTWREFEERAAAFAADLVDLRLPAQSKVALYLRNCGELLEAFYGTMKASGVPVNVNYRYGDDELVYLLTDSETSAVVFHAEFLETVRRIAPRLPGVLRWYLVGEPDPTASLPARVVPYEERTTASLGSASAPSGPRSGSDLVLVYTGGTTGMPKGVMWPQNELFEGLMNSSRDVFGLPEYDDLDDVLDAIQIPGPRGMAPCPMIHGTGLMHQVVMLLSGGTCVIFDPRRFDARQLWNAVADQKVTALVIVGDAFGRPMLEVLEEEGDALDLSALEVISSSGAVWSASCKRGLLQHLPHIRLWDTLASSEGYGVAFSYATADTVESSGSFTMSSNARVLTADGRLLARGEAGAGVVAVGGALPLGYYRDPEKSARTFQVIDGTRYSVSGDYVEVTREGRLDFRGRGSSCVNTGGEKVYVEEVDEVIRDHPAVADAVCVGAPDDRLGSIVCAVVALRPGEGLSLEELRDWVKGRLASYKAPRRLLLVDEVQRTVQGKPDYVALTELARA